MLKYYVDGETLNPYVVIEMNLKNQEKRRVYLERFMSISLVRRIHGKDLDVSRFIEEFEKNDIFYMKEL